MIIIIILLIAFLLDLAIMLGLGNVFKKYIFKK
jgi:hypothetical protein